MDFSVVVSNLSKTSIGSELLQSVAEQPGFDGLKEDPLQNFTVSDVSVAVNPDRQVAVDMKTNSCRHSEYLSTQLLNLSTPTTQREDFTILDVAAGEQAVDSAPEAALAEDGEPSANQEATESLDDHDFVTPKKKKKPKNKMDPTTPNTASTHEAGNEASPLSSADTEEQRKLGEIHLSGLKDSDALTRRPSDNVVRLADLMEGTSSGRQVVQDDVAARSGTLFSCSPACSPCCGASGVAVAAVALPSDPSGEVPAATVVGAAAAAPQTFRL
jgi:hypothetical protein